MHADLCAARWYCGHLGQKVGKKWVKSGKKVGCSGTMRRSENWCARLKMADFVKKREP